LPVKLGINTPRQFIQLDTESEGLPLPGAESSSGAAITYGQYLRAVADYFSKNSFRAIRNLLARQEGSSPSLNLADWAELISEKHGALYSVSRLKLHFPSGVRSFAVNTAFSAAQQAFLQLEWRLLRDLYRRYRLAHLPRAFLFGSTLLQTPSAALPVKLFVSEWFDGYHEFHLSPAAHSGGKNPGIRVWTGDKGGHFLDARQTVELYEQAAEILTDYLDAESFRQIYPWHHAAGDFVVKESCNPVKVRLITARGFRCLLPRGSDIRDRVLGSLHFFLNMCVRMRIDRIDGTGDLAWADLNCLPGMIRGFSSSWAKKVRGAVNPVEARDLFTLYLQFTPEERLEITGIAAGNGRVEAGESQFLGSHLPAHVGELAAALEEFI
jgi:hypothetical protein